MNKRMRTLAISMIVLCISCTVIVGGTFALFSDTDTVSNHLVAGNLDISLDRIGYTEYVLGEDGTMVLKNADTAPVDLVENDDKLFSMVNAVPSSYYEATMQVTNNGSTAFDYGVSIIWNTDGKASAQQMAFAKQIRITVSSDKINNEAHTVSFMLADCATNSVPLGYMLKGANPESFTIKAEFIDSEDNNAAMLATLDFDMQVYATQKVAL